MISSRHHLGLFIYAVLGALFSFCIFVPSDAFGSVEFSLDGVVEFHALAPGRIPLWPHWSQDARRICFAATDPALMDGTNYLSEIWILHLGAPSVSRRLLTENENGTCHCLGFVPNDSAILFYDDLWQMSFLDPWTPSLKTPTNLRECMSYASVSGPMWHCDIRETPNGYKIVVDLRESRTGKTIIFLIPTNASGVAHIASTVKIVDGLVGYDSIRLALSPSGNELLLAHRIPGRYDPDVSLITGLDRIVAGQDPPIRSLPDPRFMTFEDGPYHADGPSWSEDGSLIFYSYDFSGNFYMPQMNIDQANFDLMVVRLSEALAGNLAPTRLPMPGNTGCLCASRGGTRFVFAQSASPVNLLCAIGFACSDELHLNGLPGDSVVQEEFSLCDGSGTTVQIAPSTLVHNCAESTDPTRVILKTPVTPLAQEVLPERSSRMTVQRKLRHNNGTGSGKSNPLPLEFEPPAELELAYNNEEIRGMRESDLLVYEYNPETGRFDRFLPLIAHDLENNRITVAVSAFASAEELSKSAGAYAEGSLAAGIADSDGDGLSDGFEVRWDGDLALNPYDFITNPDGTDLNPWKRDTDDDGVMDSDELDFGTDPFDPLSAPEMPASGAVGLAILTGTLALAGVRRAQRRF